MKQVLEYLLLGMVILSFANSIHKAETSFPLALVSYIVWHLQKVVSIQSEPEVDFLRFALVQYVY